MDAAGSVSWKKKKSAVGKTLELPGDEQLLPCRLESLAVSWARDLRLLINL